MAGIAGLLQLVFRGREDGWRASMRRRASTGSRTTDAESGPDTSATGVPSGFVVVAAVGELSDGELVEAIVDGEPVVVSRADGELHAVAATCPHAGGPLGDGDLDGSTLTCPMHGWGFDVRTGACMVDSDKPLATYEVRVESGQIWVRTKSG